MELENDLNVVSGVEIGDKFDSIADGCTFSAFSRVRDRLRSAAVRNV